MGVVGVAGARDERHVGAKLPRRLDHRLVGARAYPSSPRPRAPFRGRSGAGIRRATRRRNRLACPPRGRGATTRGSEIDGDERDRVHVEHVADERPDPAVADDDDPRRFAFRRRLLRRRIGRARISGSISAPSRASAGMASIETATAVNSVVDSARSIRPPASAAPIITKPNSPPGPSSSAISALDARRQAEGAREAEQDEALRRR